MPFVILQTSCPEEVSIARIERRTKDKYESNALTVEAYLAKNRKTPLIRTLVVATLSTGQRLNYINSLTTRKVNYSPLTGRAS